MTESTDKLVATANRGRIWTLHGDGRHVRPGAVVAPDERLNCPRTIGIGMQHVIAMFGSTLLVPTITGFPVTTTLLFSGLGTVIFLLVTRNKVPSYLGSSFAFIAPLTATKADGFAVQLGGIVVVGAALFLIGLLVDRVGRGVLDAVMPPAVTGAIVSMIGLNLAPSATSNFQAQPLVAAVTLAVTLVISIGGRGMIGRLGILCGVIAGWAFAAVIGQLDPEATDRIAAAAWIGLPDFHHPTFHWDAMLLTLPVIVVLIAENVGHVKAVAGMTGKNLDDQAGRALMADGVSTVLAGGFGGSGTTTYAENIGVMASSRVYSTLAYWVAALTAVLLAFVPKFGAIIQTIPTGVLGGAALVLYGMIGLLGVRIWQENRVNLGHPLNLTTAAVAMVAGIGNLTLTIGSLQLEGIAWGSLGIIIGYPLLRWLYEHAGEGRDTRVRGYTLGALTTTTHTNE